MRVLAAVVFGVLPWFHAIGQPAHRQAVFEVASVKRAARTWEPTGMRKRGPSGTARQDPSLLLYTAVNLKRVIARAFRLPIDRVVGPSWLETELYDIAAKIPAAAPSEQIPEMLQDLRAVRFEMRSHFETKSTAGFALTPGKTPLKLTPALPDGQGSESFILGTSAGNFEFPNMTLDDFARLLTRLLGQPVVNTTQIPGKYNFSIHCDPSSLRGVGAGASAADSDPKPSIFTVVRNLGLNLEVRTVPLTQLVVDHAVKIPTEN